MDDSPDPLPGELEKFHFVWRVTLGNIIEIAIISVGLIVSFVSVKYRQDGLEKIITEQGKEIKSIEERFVRADIIAERNRVVDKQFEEIVKRLDRIERKLER